jgi:hypothetical protein
MKWTMCQINPIKRCYLTFLKSMKMWVKQSVHVGCLIDDSLTIVGDQNQIEFIIRNLVKMLLSYKQRWLC